MKKIALFFIFSQIVEKLKLPFLNKVYDKNNGFLLIPIFTKVVFNPNQEKKKIMLNGNLHKRENGEKKGFPENRFQDVMILFNA